MENEKNTFVAFQNREVNAFKTEAIFSRETLPNGIECIYVTIGESSVFKFFHNPNKSASPTPKHTGGKKPYVLLMLEAIEEMRESGVQGIDEMVGFVACLGSSVEWSSGLVRHKRSKKPMAYADIVALVGSKRKTDRLLKMLDENDLMFRGDEGYYVSRRILRKGAGRVAVRRIETYQQAFVELLETPMDNVLQAQIQEMEKRGHTEKSICYAIWKTQERLLLSRKMPNFMTILWKEVCKYSWASDDPRWVEYNKRKQLEAEVQNKQQEIKRLRGKVKGMEPR